MRNKIASVCSSKSDLLIGSFLSCKTNTPRPPGRGSSFLPGCCLLRASQLVQSFHASAKQKTPRQAFEELRKLVKAYGYDNMRKIIELIGQEKV
jgi:hypothetical protein